LEDEALGSGSSDSKAEAGDLVVPDEQVVRPSVRTGALRVNLGLLDQPLGDGLAQVPCLSVFCLARYQQLDLLMAFEQVVRKICVRVKRQIASNSTQVDAGLVAIILMFAVFSPSRPNPAQLGAADS
jgi:hypothetical protein